MNQQYPIPITVLIPVYNSASFLQATIDSVLSQTFRDFELLILDDGSTDNSANIVGNYDDSRIKYMYCAHDFIATLNKGLDLACGKYIALLDHDDLMMPDRLQIQYDYLESHPDIIACGGYMHSFGMRSEEMKAPLDHNELMKDMIFRCPMLNPTGFIRRDTIVSHEIRYQRGYSFAADFKFWSDLVKVGKIINLPKVLTLYRTSQKQASVVYRKDSDIGAYKIQQEMIDYFLSMIEEGSRFYSILDEKLLPALDDLGEYSLFSSNTYFPFMYELIDGVFNEKSRLAHQKEMIKIGYLLSYDYEYLKYSLPTIYQCADKIFLAIDKDRKTWKGENFSILDKFFKWIVEFDVDKKIQIYEDKFYIPDFTSMECETRERNMLAKKMGEGGWHIQIDVDEYFLNFKDFVAYLHTIDSSVSTTVFAEWITIFKQNDKEIFYIDSNEEFPIATNFPRYSLARYTDAANVTKKTNCKVLHQSWGRTEKEITFKLNNWGHNRDFDKDAYLNFWKSIDKYTYGYIRNFHPVSPENWEKLERMEINSISELIENMEKVFDLSHAIW